MYLCMHKYIIKEKYCQLDSGRHERGLGDHSLEGREGEHFLKMYFCE